MDFKNSVLGITLQDVDGLSINGTTYKALQGAYLLCYVKDYPKIYFKADINEDVMPSVILDSTKTYTDRLGPIGYAGYGRPTISMTCYLPVKDIDTRANYFDPTITKYSSTDLVFLNYYILFQLMQFNHRIYLKDIYPGKEASYTNLSLPINILINRTDLLNKEILSSKGLPVVIKDFTINKVDIDFDAPSLSDYMEVSINLVVDI